MEESQRYLQLERSQQHDFLYPLIFKEYIYAFAYDRGFSRSSLSENPSYNNKSSLLTVNRLITRMYQQNHFIIYYPNDSNKNTFWARRNNLYSPIISEGFAFIVEISFSLGLIYCLEGKNKNNIQISEFTINSFNISLFRGQFFTFKFCIRLIRKSFGDSINPSVGITLSVELFLDFLNGGSLLIG